MFAAIKNLTVLLFCLMLLSACKRPEYHTLKGTIQLWDWRVAFLNDKGVDKTTLFQGYSFRFAWTKEVVANKVTNFSTGSWNLQGAGENQLVIDFPASPFNQLNNLWTAIEVSHPEIKFMGPADSTGAASMLILQKAS